MVKLFPVHSDNSKTTSQIVSGRASTGHYGNKNIFMMPAMIRSTIISLNCLDLLI